MDDKTLEALEQRRAMAWGGGHRDSKENRVSLDAEQRSSPGGLYAMVREKQVPVQKAEFTSWLVRQAARLPTCTEREATAIALTVMQMAYNGRNCQVPGMADGLIQQLSNSAALSHAAAWALAWMNSESMLDKQAWHHSQEQLGRLVATAAKLGCDCETIFFLSWIFKTERTPQAVDALLLHLPNSPVRTRVAIVNALGAIGDSRATDTLIERLQDIRVNEEVKATAIALGQIGDAKGIAILTALLSDSNENLRRTALGGLAQTCENETDRQLLSDNFQLKGSWLDPLSPITADQIVKAAKRLNKPLREIQQHYAALALRFGLKLA